ncbi:hypothetical protein OPAG_03137 [Rhodococcus opacus PD630]|nr:hypothetical protein Pd630_LPD00898 [Rhodococcus opacus PD630]EHI44799.1 hypothetical protein OPAG_03137 [Rhodococcus opacus PD630]
MFCSRFEHLIIPHGDSREPLLCTDAADGVCCSKRVDFSVEPPGYPPARLSDRCNCYRAHSKASTPGGASY